MKNPIFPLAFLSILSFPAALSLSAMDHDILNMPNNFEINRNTTKAQSIKHFGTPVSQTSLKGTPKPGGPHVEILEGGDLIVVHPLPKPSVGASYAEANYVQWAVDNVNPGGTVSLDMKDINGHYRVLDLGGHTITVLNEVHIEGVKESSIMANDWDTELNENQSFEITERGIERTIKSDRAIIYNGVISIGNSNIKTLPDGTIYVKHSPPHDATIKSLRFEKSPGGATPVYSVIDLEISDIVVTNVVVGMFDLHWFYEVYGIFIVGDYGGVRGNVIVRNNYVDLFGDDPAKDPFVDWSDDSRMYGISILGFKPEPGVEGRIIEIIDNTVKNCGTTAIYILNAVGAERLIVNGNTIKQRNFPVFGNYAWGVGIDVVNLYVLEDPPIYVTGAEIRNNTMVDIPAHGMFLIGVFASEISGNAIEKILYNGKAYKYSQYGLNLLSGISVHLCVGNLFFNNAVSGEGAYAFSLAEWVGFSSLSIEEGEVDGFKSAEPIEMPPLDVWPYSSNKVFLGEATFGNTVDAPSLECGEITDLGPAGPGVPPIPNTVIGEVPCL